ncbi:MAG: hypothetical protein K2M82_02280, partial [Lachnospiraceae bacterium]|nr:hypothetical protein [Lachnospiraceae bacterium]
MGKKDSIATLFGFAKDYFGISLPETLMKKVEPFLKEIIIKKGDILFHIGNRKNVIYFVISGIMRDYYIDS